MAGQSASILRSVLLLLAASLVVLAPSAGAGELQDFVRVRGLEGDTLVGLGLVVGLDGSGDSMKDVTIAGQPYAQLMRTLGNVNTTLRDTQKLKTVAIVYVTLEVPYGGARVGDKLDVRVSAVGNAKSLRGGRLVSTFMLTDVVPSDRAQWIPYAIAEGGPVEVNEPVGTVGSIQHGARVVRDILKNPFDGDSVTLILEPQYVGYPAAAAIASAINDELSLSGISDAARVEDTKTIRVRVPQSDRTNPNDFLGKLLTFSVPSDLLRLRSRIVIDARRKVMTVDESVEFRPTAVTADQLRITTITPPVTPTVDSPVAATTVWTGLGTGEQNKSSMRLKDLLETLKRLEVPFETQVAIVESLVRQGALKAEIVKP